MIRSYETTNRLEAIARRQGHGRTNRLEAIARRQGHGRTRDLIFACFVALAAILGASTVGAAVHGASTSVTLVER